MDYPNGFDIDTFPAGKTIAYSRSISFWIAIVFFLIVAACCFLLLGSHLKKNYPFLISVDPFTEDWTVITYPDKNKNDVIYQYQIVQEKLVSDFVTNWFTISGDSEVNEARWKACDIEDCGNQEQFNPDNINCAIACKSDVALFEEFSKNVLPEYRTYSKDSGKWTVGSILNTPMSVNQTSGNWQVIISVQPAMARPFKALAFITIEQDQDKYPATLGYYIKTFNSYRIENE